MILSDLARWAGIACLVWFALAIATGCTHSTHVRALNATAVTLETTAAELLAEYERGRPSGDARAYNERWRPVADALSAAFAAHDAWRLALDSGDESAILAAAARARETFCELASVTRELAPRVPTEGLCWQVAP